MTKLSEIKEYLSKMTPGPWIVSKDDDEGVTSVRCEFENPKDGVIGWEIAEMSGCPVEDDANGIARLRTDAEYLVRRCRELEKALRDVTSCTNRHALLVAIAEAERVLKEGE